MSIKMSRFSLILFAAVFLLADRLHAGLGALRGDERGVWTTDATSVVIGTIGDVRRPQNADQISLRVAELTPIVTLAGTFDSSQHPIIPVRLWVGGIGSAIENDPPHGAIVLAVIRPDDGIYIISPALCLFMPERKGLVVIDGLGDPRVTQTIERIRAVRHKGHPATRPTTRPAD